MLARRHPVAGYWQRRDAMFDVTSCWVAVWRLYRHATCLRRLPPWRAAHRRRDLSVNSDWRRPATADADRPWAKPEQTWLIQSKGNHIHVDCRHQFQCFGVFAALILLSIGLHVRKCIQTVQVCIRRFVASPYGPTWPWYTKKKGGLNCRNSSRTTENEKRK